MPPNTLKVDRTTRWGNDFIVWESGDRWACQYVETDATITLLAEFDTRREAAADAVSRFRAEAAQCPPDTFTKLRGKGLACWCELCPTHADGKPMGVECPDCAPCHVDPLIVLANPEIEP